MLETNASALEATCTEGDLSKPDGVCEGPWEYNTYASPCYASQRAPACGIEKYEQTTCYNYNRCRHPSFGVETYSTALTTSRLIGYNNFTVGTPAKLWISKTWDGSSCSSMGNDVIPPNTPYDTTLASFCQRLAEDERTRVYQTYGVETIATGTAHTQNHVCQDFLSYMGGSGYHRYWYKCDIVLKTPVYNFGTGAVCGVKNSYSCDDTSKPPIYKSCRRPEHGLDSDPKACGLAQKQYSAFGATRTSLDALPHSATDSMIPYCLTADEITAPQEKFQSLWWRIGYIDQGGYAQVDAARLQKLIVGKLKLLLELHGEKLSAEQRGMIRDLHVQRPHQTPACGTHWKPTTAPPPTCASTTTEGTLTMCDRLTQSHVPGASANASAGMCLEARASIPPASTCADRTYLDKYLTTMPSVLQKAFSTLPETSAQLRKSALQERLGFIQSWYSGVKTGAYTGSTLTTEDLWRDVSAVTNALVLGAHANNISAFNPPAPGGSVISDAAHLDNGYAVDREIITAAFTHVPNTASPPLTQAPILPLLANAFRPVSTRLSEIDYLHDLGCRFKDCKGAFASEVSQLHLLLGSLADGAALTTAYNTRSHLVRSDWRSLFQTVVSQYDAVVKSAIIDAVGTYDASAVLGATLAQPPVHAFAELVNGSRMRANHFALTGQFRPASAEFSLVGLTQAKLDTVNMDVNAALIALNNAERDYTGARTQLLTTQLNYLNGQASDENALGQLRIKGTLVEQLTAEIEGYRTAATVDKERFGALSVSYNRAIQRLESTWGSEFLTRATFGPYTLSPADNQVVKWTGGPITDISTIAAQGPLSVSNGDLVRIAASGNWSATCAIQKAANSATPPLYVVPGAQANSQGYYAQYSGSRYDAKGYTAQHFESWSRGHTLCAGGQLGISVGQVVNIPVGSAQYCWSETEGGSRTDSASNGTEYRETAAFNAGLRVPTTPFPKYPVGSLLAVRMKRGDRHPSQIIDVEVVQAPDSLMLVSQPRTATNEFAVESDIYLVVNELSAPTCDRTNPGGLSVTVQRLQPKALFAKHFQKAMAKTHAQFQKTIAEVILPQGALLSTQIQQFESEAMSNLLAECSLDMPCDLKTFDGDLMQMYRTWIMHSLAQAERQLLMNKLEQQLRVAAMEWEVMAADLVARKRTTQLSALLPMWALRSLDLEYLKDRTERVAELVNTRLYPFIKVKYPEAIHGKAGVAQLAGLLNNASAQARFTALTSGLSWTSDWVNLAEATRKAAESIQTELNTAHSLLLKKSERNGYTVALVFKKPMAYIDPALENSIPGESWFATNYGTTLYREVSDERALAVWSAIEAHQAVQFTIQPGDLYQRGNQFERQLLCDWTVPVIRSMGIVISNDGDESNAEFNGHERIVQAKAGPDLSYVGALSLEKLTMKNDAWLNMAIPVSYSKIAQVNSVFWNTAGGSQTPPAERGAAEGLSPVGSYTLGALSNDWLNPVQSYHRRATAFVVMMNLEFRDKGDSPTWLTNCTP